MWTSERLNKERFRHAAHTYEQQHQACVSCHQPHCVFFSSWPSAEEYRCYLCGFCVWHDLQSGGYFSGHEPIEAGDVLTDSEPGLLDHLEDHPILRKV